MREKEVWTRQRRWSARGGGGGPARREQRGEVDGGGRGERGVLAHVVQVLQPHEQQLSYALDDALDDGEPLPLGDTQAMEGTEPPPGAALEGGLPSGVLEAEAEA